MTLAGRQMLSRVEMWCARHWGEAVGDARQAMARGDQVKFAEASGDARDWLTALRIVNQLKLGIDLKRFNKNFL